MGNANSTPTKDDGFEAQLQRSRSPSIKRYHSINHPAQRTPDKSSSSNFRLGRNPAVFGRISSNDETSGSTRSRSRSGSLSSFWGGPRRPSALNEELGEVREQSPLRNNLSKKASIEISDFEITSPAGGSAIETTLR